MKNLSPWNKIPKSNNQNYHFFKSSSIFDLNSSTFLPRGLGRSYGDTCLNEKGSLVLMENYKNILEIDSSKGTLKCQSGLSINEILKIIVPLGWFLPVVPGTSYVTIGGAIANDIHGKNHHKFGSFGNFVESLELLKSNGKKIICSNQNNKELFSATIGGLGLTGVILNAKIKLIKIQSSNVKTKSLKFQSLDEYFQLCENYENKFDYTVSWIDFDFSKSNYIRGIYHVGNHAEEDGSLNIEKQKSKKFNFNLPFNTPFSLVNNKSIWLLNNFYFALFKNDNEYLQHYSKFFFPLDVIKNWNRAYGKNGFYQYQFLVSKKDAKEVIEKVFLALKKYKHKPALGVLKTFGNIQSLGMLSFPAEGVTVALDLQNKGKRTLKLLNELDSIICKFDGRLYPAKDCRMSNETFKKSYKNFKEFQKYKDSKFNSDFFVRTMS